MKYLFALPLSGLLLAGPALAQTPAAFGVVADYNTALNGYNGYPISVVVADVNGDGKPDALVANQSAGTLAVLLGNGSGGFTLQAASPATSGISGSPTNLAVADVNGDGKPDVLATNRNDKTLGVLLGNGSGGFILQANSPSMGTNSYPGSVAVADVNGDGKPDALVINGNTIGTLAVLLGNGSGGFTLQATQPATGTYSVPANVAVADVNGDGKPDALVANAGDSTLGVLLGNGTGGFTLQAAAPSTGVGSQPVSLAVADVNGDGKLDVLVANAGDSTLGVLLGNGIGGFTLQAAAPSTGPNSSPYSVAVADVNGDGKLDALVANFFTKTLGVLLGNGNGSFALQTAAPSTGASSNPYSLAVADVNGDGRPDALVTSGGAGTLGVLLNTTPGFLPTRVALPGAAATLAPNPARTSTMLTATSLPAATAQVAAVLLNPLGQVVRRLTVPATAGAATATVPTAGLAPGLYLLQLQAVDAQGAGLGALPVQRLSVE